MANHVSFSVNFVQINDAAKAKWKELSDRLVKSENNHEFWMGGLWVDGQEGSPTMEETEQYAWTTENIGPKWCYIQDFDDTSFSGYSAWSAPEMGLIWILEQLEEYDPNIITSFYFEDEMPNFYGANVYEGSELFDGFEEEGDEIMQRVFSEHPEIKEMWDEEEEEWKDDDGWSAYTDVLYDIMHNVQDGTVTECVEAIQENQQDNQVNPS